MTTNKNMRVREIAGIFSSNEKLQITINDLGLAHFGRQEISILGSRAAMRRKFLTSSKDPYKLVDDSRAPRTTNITPEERGVGTGVVISLGILIGVIGAFFIIGEVARTSIVIPIVFVGGVIGSILGTTVARSIGAVNAAHLQEQIDKGGLVLWVRVNNACKENIAKNIFKKNRVENAHVHRIKTKYI